MNFRFVVLALASPALLEAAEPVAVKHRIAAESLAMLKEAFPYRPPVAHETGEIKAMGSEIVKMEPVVVVESFKQRELREKFESEAERKKNEQFSVLGGGAIYQAERIEMGAWEYRDPLKEDAKYKNKTPALKVDLLRFKF